VAVRKGELVVEIGDVALNVMVPAGLCDDLRDVAAGAPVELHTHLLVRPESWQLYGFGDESGRYVFRVLLGIPGIGPRLALAILSHLSGSQIRQAVEAKDHARFQSVPGIGKRTAARIVVELSGKLGAETEGVAAASGSPAGDAVDALVALGVGRGEALTLVRGATGERDAPPSDSAELVAAALRLRGARRP